MIKYCARYFYELEKWGWFKEKLFNNGLNEKQLEQDRNTREYYTANNVTIWRTLEDPYSKKVFANFC